MVRRIPLASLILLLPTLTCVRPPGISGNCPLDDIERQLVVEVITKLLEDALFVTEMTHDLEQGSASSLIGVNEAYRATAFLVGECMEPQEFEPFCDSAGLPPSEEQEPFWQTHDRCGQLACEAAGVRLSTVYMTMRPRTDPDDRHSFTYETDDPPGIALYDPNPFITWRVDETQQDIILFESTFEFHVTVTPTGRNMINLTHEGRYEATKENDEITGLSLTVSFPNLLEPQDVQGVLSLIDSDQISGTISSGGQTMATVTLQAGGQSEFAWTEGCSD